jgi:WD40 repeat protein
VHIWSAAAGEDLCIYRGHSQAVKALAWSPDSQHIVSGGDDARLRFWSAATGQDFAVSDEYPRWIRTIAWSPDARYIVFAYDQTVQVGML